MEVDVSELGKSLDKCRKEFEEILKDFGFLEERRRNISEELEALSKDLEGFKE